MNKRKLFFNVLGTINAALCLGMYIYSIVAKGFEMVDMYRILLSITTVVVLWKGNLVLEVVYLAFYAFLLSRLLFLYMPHPGDDSGTIFAFIACVLLIGVNPILSLTLGGVLKK